jgi:malate dehydrogenase (oxaloacetate-decarboxylating)(NADP+)
LRNFFSIRPESTIPITLDLGTNNEKNLNDPLYLGLRQKRASSEEYVEFLEEFMREMALSFPKLLVQFEDFTTDHAFEFLDLFRDRYPVFNDDIQGTGAVVLSGELRISMSSIMLLNIMPRLHQRCQAIIRSKWNAID